MKEYIIKKANTPEKAISKKAKEVDTRQITSLINSLTKTSTDDISYPSKLKRPREKLNRIINDFQRVYKEIVSREIAIMNLDIATESIIERNNIVDDIHNVVHKDRIRVYQGS